MAVLGWAERYKRWSRVSIEVPKKIKKFFSDFSHVLMTRIGESGAVSSFCGRLIDSSL